MVLEEFSVDIGIPLLNDVINTFLLNAETITISAIAIALYAIVIWHYYRLLAKRDFFRYKEFYGEGFFVTINNFLQKLEFIGKYIIIFPIISFIFFGIFAILMFLLSKDQTIPLILLTSVTVISATRITAYYNEDLARDLAKLVPLALLGVFIVQSDFFSIELLFERITQIPNFMIDILSFVIYFMVLEIGLRVLYVLKRIIIGGEVKKEVVDKEVE